jgi:peptidyl-tRNA hydrolase, PTH2 family
MKKAKQVLVIRKDLKMRRGKECSQCSHASLGAILNLMGRSWEGNEHHHIVTRILEYSSDSAMAAWLDGPFTKVTVTVNSEEELHALEIKAKEAGLVHCMITDSGQTEFHNVPTKTVLAIGPAWEEDINPITGHLPLY